MRKQSTAMNRVAAVIRTTTTPTMVSCRTSAMAWEEMAMPTTEAEARTSSRLPS